MTLTGGEELHVLLIEDSDDGAALIVQGCMEWTGTVTVTRVETEEESSRDNPIRLARAMKCKRASAARSKLRYPDAVLPGVGTDRSARNSAPSTWKHQRVPPALRSVDRSCDDHRP